MATKSGGCGTCGDQAKEASDPNPYSEIPEIPSPVGGPSTLTPLGLTSSPEGATMPLSLYGEESVNVVDQRDLWTPTEDAKLFNNQTGEITYDPTINNGMMGWRDDPVTGDRTWLGLDGKSVSVQHPDGTFSEPTDGLQRR